ncbi:MAG: hypothetical protein U0R72_20450 [Nakamurella multipartita]
MAAAMVKVLGDPAAADRMGAQAQQHARSSASWASVVDKAVPAYRAAVAAVRR